MMKLFKILVVWEWISFILLILGCLIFVCLINLSPKYKKYSKEPVKLKKMDQAYIIFRNIRINITIIIPIAIIALLNLWYLKNNNSLAILNTLPSEFFLFSTLALIPMPIGILVFEFYLKIILKKLKE